MKLFLWIAGILLFCIFTMMTGQHGITSNGVGDTKGYIGFIMTVFVIWGIVRLLMPSKKKKEE